MTIDILKLHDCSSGAFDLNVMDAPRITLRLFVVREENCLQGARDHPRCSWPSVSDTCQQATVVMAETRLGIRVLPNDSLERCSKDRKPTRGEAEEADERGWIGTNYGVPRLIKIRKFMGVQRARSGGVLKIFATQDVGRRDRLSQR